MQFTLSMERECEFYLVVGVERDGEGAELVYLGSFGGDERELIGMAESLSLFNLGDERELI